jgi:peptidoglycan/LPS O-acetylase OafA/YrhL
MNAASVAGLRDRVRLNNFDLLRLFAATQVMIIHGFEHLKVPLGPVTRPIHYLLLYFPGVPIFFFMSGFLISMSYERNRDVKSYARNRLLRIYPALWFCFAVSLLTVAAFGYWGRSGASLHTFAPWALAQLTVFQFYNPDFLRGFGVGVLNGSLWTISVELQFYLVLPLLLAALRGSPLRRQNLILLALIGAGTLIDYAVVAAMPRYGEQTRFKLFTVTLVPYLHMFLVGVFIQKNFETFLPWLENKGAYWLALYVGVALSLHATVGFRPGSVHPNALTVLLLALAAMSCAFTLPGASQRLLRGNDVSYGTYIYHMIVVNAAVQLSWTGNLAALVLVCAVTYAAAALSWTAIEKPALRAKVKPLRAVDAAEPPVVIVTDPAVQVGTPDARPR